MPSKEKNTGSGCLSSSTYLNTRVLRVPIPGPDEGGPVRWVEKFRQVPIVDLKAELDHIAEQMSYAVAEDYLYLKGQYVALCRVLNPDILEGNAQIKAGIAERVWRLDEEALKGMMITSNPMTDNQYLEFCSIGQLDDGWQLKYSGDVEYGDMVWSFECERWELAQSDDVGFPGADRWAAEKKEKEKVA